MHLDHEAVTNPDYKTPFADVKDAVKRLLPYHVYQSVEMNEQMEIEGKPSLRLISN